MVTDRPNFVPDTGQRLPELDRTRYSASFCRGMAPEKAHWLPKIGRDDIGYIPGLYLAHDQPGIGRGSFLVAFWPRILPDIGIYLMPYLDPVMMGNGRCMRPWSGHREITERSLRLGRRKLHRHGGERWQWKRWRTDFWEMLSVGLRQFGST